MNAEIIDRYIALLQFWNRKINLTAVRDAEGIRERHFGDALAAAPHIPTGARTLVDVGSGAGFPGAVLALACPDLAVTLLEPNRKKAAFLEALRRELPLPNVTVRSDRAEKVTDRFDVAVSRATFPLPDWLNMGARLVVPGGLVMGFEGATAEVLPDGAVRLPYSPNRSLILYVPRGTSPDPGQSPGSRST